MPAPTFLELDKIVRLHTDLLERYGGSAGIRDRGMLESAVSMPKAMFGGDYLHGDIYEMAAAYLFHLVQNHPFIDGNKRIGAASAIVFLAMNDIRIEADEAGLVDLTLATARGETDKPHIAAFFRKRSE